MPTLISYVFAAILTLLTAVPNCLYACTVALMRICGEMETVADAVVFALLLPVARPLTVLNTLFVHFSTAPAGIYEALMAAYEAEDA